MTNEEKDDIMETARRTSTALMLLSRGKCWIEVSEKGCKLTGDEKGLEILKRMIDQGPKPNGTILREVFDYFGHSYEYDAEQKSMTGEGIVAYMFFQILMGGVEDQEIERNFFADLRLKI